MIYVGFFKTDKENDYWEYFSHNCQKNFLLESMEELINGLVDEWIVEEVEDEGQLETLIATRLGE